MEERNYSKLALMMSVSFIIMYLVMFLNIVELNHFYISATRIYMAILMVMPMAVVMLIFMRKMYNNKKLNTIIIIASILVFTITLIFLRTQTFIGDKQYMQAMIPHHSSAILTSRNANIIDPEVKKLANDIIKAQEHEIKLMEQYLEKLD